MVFIESPPTVPPTQSSTTKPKGTGISVESSDKGDLFGLKNPLDWMVLAIVNIVFAFFILLLICF